MPGRFLLTDYGIVIVFLFEYLTRGCQTERASGAKKNGEGVATADGSSPSPQPSPAGRGCLASAAFKTPLLFVSTACFSLSPVGERVRVRG